MKKIFFKKILLIGSALIAIGFFLYFFWRYSYKSKATEDEVTVSFVEKSVQADQNALIYVPVMITAKDNTKKISAVDLRFKFDSDDKDLLQFHNWLSSAYGETEAPYFDEEVLKEIEEKDGAKNLRLVLVSKKADDQLGSNIVLRLVFKTNFKEGETAVSLIEGENQVSGTATQTFF